MTAHTHHKMIACNLSMIHLHWREHNNANQYSLNAVLQFLFHRLIHYVASNNIDINDQNTSYVFQWHFFFFLYSIFYFFWDVLPTLVAESCWGGKKPPVSSFSIMFICSAVWWLKTMWKTISCKQSSEIIWLVEEWYCQAPLLDIIEPLKWGSAAGCVVACSTSLFFHAVTLSWGHWTIWIKWAREKKPKKQHVATVFCDICSAWHVSVFAWRFTSQCSQFNRWATEARLPSLSPKCKWMRWKILKV